jgi:cytochrome c oxidase cbb3-type subunit I/II
MENPRSVSVGSNMPSYPWMLEKDTNIAALPAKIRVQRTLGVPFENMSPQEIFDNANAQAKAIADNLRDSGVYVAPEKQIIALIAYLQKLGTYETPAEKPSVAGN